VTRPSRVSHTIPTRIALAHKAIILSEDYKQKNRYTLRCVV
jgi:hypothetical protein